MRRPFPSLRTLLLVLTFAAPLVAAAPAGAASTPKYADSFHLRGTHGYEISAEISRSITFLQASSKEGRTGQSAYAEFGGVAPQRGRIRIRFGNVASFDYRFVPSGPPKVRRLSILCAGRPPRSWHGHFVGSFRFRGESGYTEVHTTHVKGTRELPGRVKCRHLPRASHHHRHLRRLHPKTTKSVLLQASGETEGGEVDLTATAPATGHGLGFIMARASEQREGMFVARFATAQAKPGVTFDFDADLNSASLSPAAPFAGSATFTRIDDYTTRWEGPLSVSFPGMPDVPLSGRTFSWSLGHTSESGGGSVNFVYQTIR